jgi:hypothetical protein
MPEERVELDLLDAAMLLNYTIENKRQSVITEGSFSGGGHERFSRRGSIL